MSPDPIFPTSDAGAGFLANGLKLAGCEGLGAC